MKQVISLVRDGHVQYALVDDEAGELTPFAEILLPNSDSFGLHEAAVLGSNLIQALGLDGKQPRRRTIIDTDVPAELSAAQAKIEHKRAKDREYNRRYQERKRTGTKPIRPRISHEQAAQRYKALTEYVREHPDTLTGDVAAGIDRELYATVASVEGAVRSDLLRLRDRGIVTTRLDTGPGTTGRGLNRWTLTEHQPEQPPLPKWMTHPDIGPNVASTPQEEEPTEASVEN